VPLPLSFQERDRCYELQVYLHAIKRCNQCGTWLPVEIFGGWGVQPCDECEHQNARHKRAHWR